MKDPSEGKTPPSDQKAAKTVGRKEEKISEVQPASRQPLPQETAQASGHFPQQPNMSFNPQVNAAVTPAPVAETKKPDAKPGPEQDPMARLTELVAKEQQQPQGKAPEMPAPVAVPPMEVAAAERPAPTTVRQKKPFPVKGLFSFKGNKKQSVPAAAEAAPVPQQPAGKKWLSRKEKSPAAQQEAALQAHHARTGREKRWARRRRRLWLEELLGWIFVPIILIGLYWAIIGVIAMMGTTPEAIISGVKQIMSHF